MKNICIKLNNFGTINIQFMKKNNTYLPIEINSRFSGTTPIRAHYGFNEPEMAIRSYYLNEKITPPTIGSGMAFRYVNEVFLDGFSADQLKEPFAKGSVNTWF